jgi:uncharacterized protein YukE
MSSVRIDTAELRAAASRLRDEAATQVAEANAASRRTEDQYVLAVAFDTYGSVGAYRAVSSAWRGELGSLTAALRQLADALDAAADDYDRADAAGAARLGAVR